MTSPAELSSESMDWQTPGWFLDLVREVAPIGFDPCPGENNPTGALAYQTQGAPGEPCGLSVPWTRPEGTLAFVNPPYGPYLSGPVEPGYEHTKRCEGCGGRGYYYVSHYICGKCGGAGRRVVGRGRGWARRIAEEPGLWLALVPSRTDTEWYHTLLGACDVALLWRSDQHGARIQFVDPRTGRAQKGNTSPSTVFFGGDWRARQFLTVFGPHGTLVRAR